MKRHFRPALRLEIVPTKLSATHETLTIDFTGLHSNGAELFVAWADTRLAVPFVVDTDTKVREEIDAKYDGEELTVGFNGRYLMDVLGALDTDEVQIDLSGPSDACVLRPVGTPGYLGVIMPMRL